MNTVPQLDELLIAMKVPVGCIQHVPFYSEKMLVLAAEGRKFRSDTSPDVVQRCAELEKAAFARTEDALQILHEKVLHAREEDAIRDAQDDKVEVQAFVENAKLGLRRNSEVFSCLAKHEETLRWASQKLTARHWWVLLRQELTLFKEQHKPAKELHKAGKQALGRIGGTIVKMAKMATTMKDLVADSPQDESLCAYGVRRLKVLGQHFHLPENREDGGLMLGKLSAQAAGKLLLLLPEMQDMDRAVETKEIHALIWGYQITDLRRKLRAMMDANPEAPVGQQEILRNKLRDASVLPPNVGKNDVDAEWEGLRTELDQDAAYFRGALRTEHLAMIANETGVVAAGMEQLVWRSVEAAQGWPQTVAACQPTLLRRVGEGEGRTFATTDFKASNGRLQGCVEAYRKAKIHWDLPDLHGENTMGEADAAISGANLLITEAQFVSSLTGTLGEKLKKTQLLSVDTLRVARGVPVSAVPGSACVLSFSVWCSGGGLSCRALFDGPPTIPTFRRSPPAGAGLPPPSDVLAFHFGSTLAAHSVASAQHFGSSRLASFWPPCVLGCQVHPIIVKQVEELIGTSLKQG